LDTPFITLISFISFFFNDYATIWSWLSSSLASFLWSLPLSRISMHWTIAFHRFYGWGIFVLLALLKTMAGPNKNAWDEVFHRMKTNTNEMKFPLVPLQDFAHFTLLLVLSFVISKQCMIYL